MNLFFKSNNSILKKTKSLEKLFIVQVYGWITCGLILTSFVSWCTYNTPFLLKLICYNSSIIIFISFLELILVFFISNNIKYINGNLATFLFMLYSLLTGLTISGILIIYTSISIFSSFLSTAGIFGIMTIYGYITKNDLRKFENLLLMVILGIFLGSIINILMNNTFLMWLINYLSIIIFIFLIAYDTQKIKIFGKKYILYKDDKLKKYSIISALTLYLNIINIFLILLRIFDDRE